MPVLCEEGGAGTACQVQVALMSAPPGSDFVMAQGKAKVLFKSRKCVMRNGKQFVVQRMTEVYCAPLACLDQVVGEAPFGEAVTDCADCSPLFRRPAECAAASKRARSRDAGGSFAERQGATLMATSELH